MVSSDSILKKNHMLAQDEEISEVKAQLLYALYSLCIAVQLIIAYYLLMASGEAIVVGGEYAVIRCVGYLLGFGVIVLISRHLMYYLLIYLNFVGSSIQVVLYGLLFWAMGYMPVPESIFGLRAICVAACFFHLFVLSTLLVKGYFPLGEDQEDETRQHPTLHFISKLKEFVVFLFVQFYIGLVFLKFRNSLLFNLYGDEELRTTIDWTGKIHALTAIVAAAILIRAATYKRVMRRIIVFVIIGICVIVGSYLGYRRVEGEFHLRQIGAGPYQLQYDRVLQLGVRKLSIERAEQGDDMEDPRITWEVRKKSPGQRKQLDHYELQPGESVWGDRDYVSFRSWEKKEEEGEGVDQDEHIWTAKAVIAEVHAMHSGLLLVYLAFLCYIFALLVRELRNRVLIARENAE